MSLKEQHLVHKLVYCRPFINKKCMQLYQEQLLATTKFTQKYQWITLVLRLTNEKQILFLKKKIDHFWPLLEKYLATLEKIQRQPCNKKWRPIVQESRCQQSRSSSISYYASIYAILATNSYKNENMKAIMKNNEIMKIIRRHRSDRRGRWTVI